MRWVLPMLLAVCVFTVYPAAASQNESSREESRREQPPEENSRGRMWLILGGTVAGVTGMWIGLYKRGK